jgi:osmotically-inducible protein OsmY
MLLFRLFATVAAATLVLTLYACAKTPPMAKAVAAPVVPGVSDMDISAGVKSALQRDDATRPFEVIVYSNQGDLRMAGVMDTQAQVDQALVLARAVEGVRTVRAELSVQR